MKLNIFTLNINILYDVYVFKMETRITWPMIYVFNDNNNNNNNNKSRRIIAYVAKKLMDNDIFLVIAKNTILLWLWQ